MDIVDIEREEMADIAALKTELDAKNKVCANVHNTLVAHVKNVLEANIDRKVAEVSCATDSMAEIAIKDGKHHRSFELYYHKTFGENSRKLELNFGCFGSFSSNDACAIHYCEVLGHVAGILGSLEEHLLKIPKAKAIFDAYDTACSEAWNARHALEDAQQEERKYADEIKKAEIAPKIVVGAKVVVHRKSKWCDEIVKTIEHITGKNVLFKEDYGKRTKKDELIANIISNKWEIAV